MTVALALACLALLPAPQDAPAAEPAKPALRGEWVDLTQGRRKVHCYVVQPEGKPAAQAVVVIHENKGLDYWGISVAERLAGAGYVALAPDLLTGLGPGGRNSDAFKDQLVAATRATRRLDPSQVMADLDAVVEHARTLPACSGKVSVAGFSWGGRKAFEFAAHRKDLVAAYVFCGNAPSDEVLAAVACPVYGFYGETDAPVTLEVPAVAEVMKKAGKSFEPVVYAGAGHGFLRGGEGSKPSDADRAALAAAWERWGKLLATPAAAGPDTGSKSGSK